MEMNENKPVFKWMEVTEVQGPSGLTAEQALDWLKTGTTPEIIYPDDCGRPHQWEKFTVADNQCQCPHCGNGFEAWMECANCMTRQNCDVMTDETRAIWDAAPWG